MSALSLQPAMSVSTSEIAQAAPDLSVVIVSWNTRELLANCLESLARDGLERAEIFVVDNASTDGTAEMVRKRFRETNFIANSENVGFAAANNQALRLCRGKYILLLNPDTIVQRGAIQALVGFLDTHPSVAVAAPCLLNSNGSLQVSCEPFPTLFREFWRLFHIDDFRRYATYDPGIWQSNLAQRVDIARGACLLVRRTDLENLKWFDEQFFMYSEEVDLCWRLHRAGREIYWVPQAKVVHLGGQSTRQVGDAMFLKLYRGKLQYFRKHYGRRAELAYRLLLVAAAVARLVIAPLAVLERAPQRGVHLDLARRYARLLIDLTVA